MMGGRHLGEHRHDKKALARIALATVSKALAIEESPRKIMVKVLDKCIAQYTVGHKGRIEQARESLRGQPVSLVGSSYDGVGINEAILSAKRQVEALQKS